jgi:recombination protein RecA
MSAKEEKEKDPFLEALKGITKTYGKDAIIFGEMMPDIPKQSSGVLSLDFALGGGFGKGKIVEVFGENSAGKTTISILAASEAQKDEPDKYVAIIDAEHALDANYCKSLGLDMSKVLICQPDHGEQGTQIALDLMETGKISFLFIDSIAALTPKAIIEGEMEDNSMAQHARLMSKFLAKALAITNKTGTVMYMANQYRNKINSYGNPQITTGGEAPKFYCSQRIELRAKKEEGYKLVTATIIKNKLAAPYKVCTMRVGFGYGVDKVFDTFEIAVSLNVIQKAGNTWSFKGQKIEIGRDKTYEAFQSNLELQNAIREEVIKRIKDGTARTTTDADPSAEPF